MQCTEHESLHRAWLLHTIIITAPQSCSQGHTSRGCINCRGPLFTASSRDLCETPRKVQSIKAAVLIYETGSFLVWDDCIAPSGNSVKAAAGPQNGVKEPEFVLFIAFIEKMLDVGFFINRNLSCWAQIISGHFSSVGTRRAVVMCGVF